MGGVGCRVLGAGFWGVRLRVKGRPQHTAIPRKALRISCKPPFISTEK